MSIPVETTTDTATARAALMRQAADLIDQYDLDHAETESITVYARHRSWVPADTATAVALVHRLLDEPGAKLQLTDADEHYAVVVVPRPAGIVRVKFGREVVCEHTVAVREVPVWRLRDEPAAVPA
jgi:hypothetical protein